MTACNLSPNLADARLFESFLTSSLLLRAVVSLGAVHPWEAPGNAGSGK